MTLHQLRGDPLLQLFGFGAGGHGMRFAPERDQGDAARQQALARPRP